MPEARDRVLRQVVEALLFEHLVEQEVLPRAALQQDWRGSESPFYDRQARFFAGGQQWSCLLRVGAFGRIRVAPGSVLRRDQNHSKVDITELVSALEMDEAARQRFLSELHQTISLCEWNARNLGHRQASRRSLDFAELESRIVEGHLYHPCFKARTGFTLQDHQDFGPEAGGQFRLEWLAVRRASLRVSVPGGLVDFFIQELGAGEYYRLKAAVSQQVEDGQHYSLIPVHPWQLNHLMERGLKAAFSERDLIHLGPAGDDYRATQSLRTLVNVTRPERANIKLPLAIVCTSVPRNLRRHFVVTAPALSNWLATVVDEDRYLRARNQVILLREYAGLLYAPEGDESWKEHLSDGQLGVIFRESILDKLCPHEKAVPFTALMLTEADGRPFIIEWLEVHGVERWVNRLIDVMVVPLWHMFVHHGIAFEAHAQNLILVHSDGWPEKIALRDFHEDTEYVSDYLRRPELIPDFGAIDPYFLTVPDDDGYRMGEVADLAELFMDTVYVFNLAELSFLLERHLGFPEARFWSIVRAHIDDYQRSVVTEQSRIERAGCTSPTIFVESLLEKKLRGGAVLDFFSHEVPNPLHG